MMKNLLFCVAVVMALAGREPGLAAEWEVKEQRGTRFVPVDVMVDSGSNPLSAYQVTFVVKKGDVRIVGIEGGEHPAFEEAPYYDPKAMQKKKVILAAFDTGKDLPTGRTRVATIHLEIRGKTVPRFELGVDAVAGGDGETIEVETKLEQRNSK